MAEYSTEHFFSGYHDYTPYYNLLYGTISDGKFVQSYNFGSLYKNSIKSIKVTDKIIANSKNGKKGASKPNNMTLTLEFNSSDFLDIPLLVASDIYEVPTQENIDKAPVRTVFNEKILVLKCGYTNFKSNTRLRMYKVSDVKDVNKNFNYKDIDRQYYEVPIPSNFTIFSGVLGNPTSITGDESSMHTMNFEVKLVSLETVGKGKDNINSTIATTTSPDVLKDITSILLGIKDKYFRETKFLNFKWDLSNLSSYKLDQTLFSDTKPIFSVGMLESKLEFLERICKQYGVTFTIQYESTGAETWVFSPATMAGAYKSYQSKSVWGFSTLPQADYAVYLRYGEAVIHYSYSFSPVVSDGSGKTGGTQITVQNTKGEFITYELDKKKVEAYEQNGGTLDELVSMAETDPNKLIATFYNGYFSDKSDNNAVRPIGDGKRIGIKLRLKLRYAIPGVQAGAFCFFDLPDKIRNVIGKYLVGVYQIEEVINTYNPEKDAWTQELDCVR